MEYCGVTVGIFDLALVRDLSLCSNKARVLTTNDRGQHRRGTVAVQGPDYFTVLCRTVDLDQHPSEDLFKDDSGLLRNVG